MDLCLGINGIDAPAEEGAYGQFLFEGISVMRNPHYMFLEELLPERRYDLIRVGAPTNQYLQLFSRT